MRRIYCCMRRGRAAIGRTGRLARSWGLEIRWWARVALGGIALGCGVLFVALAPGATAGAAGRAAPAFSAHGSAEQVYVTGLAPRARMSLLDPSGRAVATKRADGLGGLLFRNVKPGGGYRVRPTAGGPKSGPLRVFSTRPA